MNNQEKSAKRLLTLTPNREFHLEDDGFVGCLYEPSEDNFPGKALIVFGGSDANFTLTRLLAEKFVERGLTTMALAYWGYPGLPSKIEEIPVETVERPAVWLKTNGFEKIGVWGISKGAELALISGTLMPELINCVVAVCPINICCQGISKNHFVRLLPCSSWSWRGKGLPYTDLKFPIGEVVLKSLEKKGLCLSPCYEEAVFESGEEAHIPVEKIGGPVLFLAPEHDDMWPSAFSAKTMMNRLDRKGFAHEHHFHSYAYASHLLIPMEIKGRWVFQIERKHPIECMKSNEESFEKTLEFLKNVW